MATDDFSIKIQAGPVEMVECGEERLWRVPVLIDGEEIGDVIGTFEDFYDE